MSNILKAKNKLGFILANIRPIDDAYDETYVCWIVC